MAPSASPTPPRAPRLRRRALVAVSARAQRRMREILEGWTIDWVLSRSHALQAAASGRFDLIVVGAHFDASNALDLICEMQRAAPGCPLVCVRALPFQSGLGAASFDAFRTACAELGAHQVLDLLEFPGDEAGRARIRRMLERLLADAP